MAAALVAVLLVGGLVLATDATTRMKASWDRLARVLDTINTRSGTELTLTDFDRLQSGVADLNTTLAGARRQTGFLRPLAAVHADLQALFEALDIAQELAQAADDMLLGLQPTLFFMAAGEDDEAVVTQVSSGERVVELLRLGRGRFLSADAHLTAALIRIADLDLATISPDLLLMTQMLIRYQGELAAINRILLEAPDLLTTALGLDEPQNYLVLSQNSDELRPSGGYISTFGWLRVRNARIIDYDYGPTTPTSPNPPPLALSGAVDVPGWWIQYGQPLYAAWDGSWYADFPSTAAMAAWFYDHGDNPQSPVDGVIAIDIVGFEYLLAGLGSVRVPGYDEIVTPENFREAVYAIRAEGVSDRTPGEPDRPHKRFLAALYRQILADWQTVDRQRGGELFNAVLRALREKHIMLYFTDEALNEAISRLGWAGAQGAAIDHDYLMVADANLGNKSNRSIARQLTYDVEILPDGRLRSRATVNYDYSALTAAADPAVRPEHYGDIDYHNLMQVFVPAGSQLLGTNNLPAEPTTVALTDHTAFVALTEVAYNTGERFQFTYGTPVLVEQFGPYRRYRLLLQKQPGMIGEPVSVQVTLPADGQVVSATPGPVASYSLEQPILEFRLALVTDQWIEVIFRQ